jgi:hypothetical protein
MAGVNAKSQEPLLAFAYPKNRWIHPEAGPAELVLRATLQLNAAS